MLFPPRCGIWEFQLIGVMAGLSIGRYDPQAHQIVYQKQRERTVCALVQDRRGILGEHYRIKNTGSCTVISQDVGHTDDDGWTLHHYTALDVYFEVRQSK